MFFFNSHLKHFELHLDMSERCYINKVRLIDQNTVSFHNDTLETFYSAFC